MNKRCYRCKEIKPVSDFNRDRARFDGLQPGCKACQLEANRVWASRHPEVRRAALKRQYQDERMRLNGQRPSKIADPIKRRAHKAVCRAIKSGFLTRPDHCPECGENKFPIEGHHDDYSQPLAIKWLCAPCHGRLHAARSKA
jgi:hypothetical protein